MRNFFFQIAETRNWTQIVDREILRKICQEVIDKSPKAVKQYRQGKSKVLFALAGEVIKATEHRANMSIAVEILQQLLK